MSELARSAFFWVVVRFGRERSLFYFETPE